MFSLLNQQLPDAGNFDADDLEWIEAASKDARREIAYIRRIISFHERQLNIHRARLAWLERSAK